MASVFTPSVGTAHEWSTSSAVTMMRMGDSIGMTMRWSTSRSRKCPSGSSVVGIMYESKERSLKSVYSYDQYHWCPMAFRVRSGSSISSII